MAEKQKEKREKEMEVKRLVQEKQAELDAQKLANDIRLEEENCRLVDLQTENEKKIILDRYSADITLLTALISGDQLNTLACVMERLLTDKEAGNGELLDKAGQYTALALDKMQTENGVSSLLPEMARLFFGEIRPIDVFCCVNRMRGLRFQLVTAQP